MAILIIRLGLWLVRQPTDSKDYRKNSAPRKIVEKDFDKAIFGHSHKIGVRWRSRTSACRLVLHLFVARLARSFYCVQHVCMVLARLVNRMAARNKPFRGWGPRLKALREGLEISLQDVERYSRQFAQLVGNKSFVIPPSSLSDIEKQKALPNIYKLISLSAVYRVRFPELLLIFGADLDDITKFQKEFPLPQPALLSLDIYHPNHTVNFPVKYDPRIDLRQSTVLSYFVQSW